jgi:hypothetical protein
MEKRVSGVTEEQQADRLNWGYFTIQEIVTIRAMVFISPWRSRP